MCGSSLTRSETTGVMRDLPISARPRSRQCNPRRAPPAPRCTSSISSSSTSGVVVAPRLKPVLRAADAQRLPHRYILGETTSDVSPRDLKNRCSPGEKRGSWAWHADVWSRSGRRWRHGSRNILAPPVIDRPERHPFAPFRWAYGVDRCRVGKSTAQDVWQPYGTAICEIHIDFFD